jgi:hypothetical protein
LCSSEYPRKMQGIERGDNLFGEVAYALRKHRQAKRRSSA